MLDQTLRILMINDHIHFGGGGDAVFRLERSCYEDTGFEVFTFSQAEEKPAKTSSRSKAKAASDESAAETTEKEA